MLMLSQDAAEPTVYIRLPDGQIATVTLVRIGRAQARLGYSFPPEYQIKRKLEWLDREPEPDHS